MDIDRPTAIVIIGGGGDLSQRKLLPAFFNLFRNDSLPKRFSIIGLARTERTNQEYRALVSSAVNAHAPSPEQELISAFCDHVRYVSGSFDEQESYSSLQNAITGFEQDAGERANVLFYLAVPPANYAVIFKTLHQSGLTAEHSTARWARVLVEKPFGNNYQTAVALETLLRERFAEDQIFRIDHYLAKEAVMNILAFRFANTLLRSSWSKEDIEEVRITMFETVDARARGAFYDTVGALRDVGQNHLLQILALIAMDEPESFSADSIRTQRQRILEKLIPFSAQQIKHAVTRAQYDKYQDTPGVLENSQTETYFEFIAHVDHKNWDQVPFKIRAGKSLDHDEVTVEILFKDVAKGPFKPERMTTTGNRLILTVSPVQSMNMTLNMKEPGYGFDLEQNTLSFAWEEGSEQGYTAYEKILLDCIRGDLTLFTKTEEVLASWKFITSILDQWDQVPLQTYKQGSEGPENSLFKRV